MTTQIDLEVIEKRIKQLPFLPTVLSELMMIDESDQEYYEKVFKLAKQDPPLTTMILRIANSTHYNRGNMQVDTLERALSRIGAKTVIRAFATTNVAKVFVPATAAHKSLWWHSIETGIIARNIAEATPSLKINPSLAYICGLLHDIGRFVLLEFAPDVIDESFDAELKTPDELPEFERGMAGHDHAEIGYLACQHWQIPSSISNVVRAHHMYSIVDSRYPDSFKNLIVIVQFADYISMFMENNPNWVDLEPNEFGMKIESDCLRKAWSQMSFQIPNIAEMLQKSRDEINDTAKIVGIM